MAGYALPAELDERQVIASFQRDQHDGFELLYRRYAPALVAFCERRLGNRTEAEDAAHDALLKAQRALPRFRDGARLWPWLATIAANVCTDVQRTRDRSQPADVLFDRPGGDVDEDAERRTRSRIVDAALDELPDRFRVPLVLREFGGWSYEEIADFSGKSVGSVRTTLTRARRALQCRVEDVARRQGQWPLPAALATKWRALKDTVRGWRETVGLRTSRAAGSAWQLDGMAALVAGGVQAVVAGVATLGALGMMPAAGASIDVSMASPAASVSADIALGGAAAAAHVATESARTTAAASARPPAADAPGGAVTWWAAQSVDTPAGPLSASTGSGTNGRRDERRTTRLPWVDATAGPVHLEGGLVVEGDCVDVVGDSRCEAEDTVITVGEAQS